MLFNSASASLLNSIDMILIFVAFFASVLFCSGVKKAYYHFFKKKKYYIFPKTSVKGISAIAMTVALSVAVLILVTIITSNAMAILFRAFPGTRITIEAILIKIGGLLFGPFIGMFIGGITDLLTIALTAGIFHYGYFIAALTFGLIGGLVRTIINYSKNNTFKLTVMSTVSLAIMCISVILFMYFTIPVDLEINFTFIINFSFYSWHFMVFIAVLTIIAILMIFFFYFVSNKNKKGWCARHITTFIAVITLVFLTEIFVNIFMLPVFDADLSTLSYFQWIAIRSLLFVPMIIFNILVIWPIFEIVKPLVKYDYMDDVLDSGDLQKKAKIKKCLYI